jgi:hypothetical protein
MTEEKTETVSCCYCKEQININAKEGKNILKGYKDHFGVDWLCAIKKLQILINLD